MAPRPKLDLVILDCPDALVLGQFYADVLGWQLEAGSDERWATLAPPGGGLSPTNPDGRTTLAFQRIEDYVEPSWPGGSHPQQFHLDLATEDMDGSEAEVLRLGAGKHEHQPSENDGFRVYVDPAGHPFCLIRAS